MIDPSCRAMLLRISLVIIICGAVHGLPTVAEAHPDQGTSSMDRAIREDEDVPYGVAANWLVGHRILRDGDAAAALPYLHMAYRGNPDEPAIALDFEQALMAEGHLRDALRVMDKLVRDWPDSLAYRVERSSLYLKIGLPDEALADLQHVREGGLVNLEVVEAEVALLMSFGRPDSALEVFRAALAALPAAGEEIYLRMSSLLQDLDRLGEIPALLKQGVEEYPRSHVLRTVLMRSLAANNRHEDALQVAAEAEIDFAAAAADTSQLAAPEDLSQPSGISETSLRLHEEPPPESFLMELSLFYSRRGDFDRAIEIMASIAAENSLDSGPFLHQVRMLLQAGRLEEAQPILQDLLSRWPAEAEGWYLQAKTEELIENWEQALPHYARAVELAPEDSRIRADYLRAMLVAWEQELTLGSRSEESTPKEDEFRNNVEFSVDLIPGGDTQGQLVLGFGLKILGDLPAAMDHFQLAARDDEFRLTAMIQLSICLDELGEIDRARSTLETLRKEFPDDPEVANSLGYFLAEKNLDLDLAESLVREALVLEPGNGAFLDSLGWVYFRRGQFENSLDFLIQAVNVLPEDPIVLEHLGLVLGRLGQFREALDVLERALRLGGDGMRLEKAIAETRLLLDRQE